MADFLLGWEFLAIHVVVLEDLDLVWLGNLLLHRGLCLSQEGRPIINIHSLCSFVDLDLLIDVRHGDRDRSTHLLNSLVTLLQLALNPPDGQLQKLVLSLRLYDLVLEEVLVLLESLCTRCPMFYLFVELLLFILYLFPLAIQTVHLLVQLVDSLVLQRIVAILGIQLLNECLQLLLFRLDVDGVPLQIVMLLLLQLVVELRIQLLNHIIEVLASLLDLRVLLRPLSRCSVPSTRKLEG